MLMNGFEIVGIKVIFLRCNKIAALNLIMGTGADSKFDLFVDRRIIN